MRAPGPDRITLAGLEPDLFLGVPYEDPESALEHIESVLDIVVIVPGHLLLGPDLKLRDPEAWALGVTGPPLDLVEPTRILDGFAVAHDVTRPASPIRVTINRASISLFGFMISPPFARGSHRGRGEVKHGKNGDREVC